MSRSFAGAAPGSVDPAVQQMAAEALAVADQAITKAELGEQNQATMAERVESLEGTTGGLKGEVGDALAGIAALQEQLASVQLTPGPQGERGEQGIPGSAGQAGATGSQGSKGDPGAAGPAGAKGDAGSPGPVGAKGDTGAVGPTGPAGPQGAKGDTGATGSQGAKGDAGAAGPAGPVGPQGPVGAAGAQGATGPAGSNASATKVRTKSASLTAILALGGSRPVSVTWKRPLPDGNYDVEVSPGPGMVGLNEENFAVSAKTATGCTVTVTAGLGLAIGATLYAQATWPAES